MTVGAVACGAPAPAPPSPPIGPPVTAAATAPADRRAEPVRVRLAAIGVDALVAPVGVVNGEMEVPYDVATIGWYRFGPRPGAPAGSAVLSGHVDDRVQGNGAFFALVDAAVGDTVTVDLDDGTTREFRVRTVEIVGKDALPVDRVFERSGPPRLTLVTCGGEFDRGIGRFRDNVVVTAEPV